MLNIYMTDASLQFKLECNHLLQTNEFLKQFPGLETIGQHVYED